MKDTDHPYYSMDFIEEDGKTYVRFYDPQGDLVAFKGCKSLFIDRDQYVFIVGMQCGGNQV